MPKPSKSSRTIILILTLVMLLGGGVLPARSVDLDSTLALIPAHNERSRGEGQQLSHNHVLQQGDRPDAAAAPEPAPLIVTATQPSDGASEVDAKSQIVAVFNRPVVSLSGVEDQTSLPQPLTVTPAVEGRGEWLNTSIYVFKPTRGLVGGIEYEATVAGVSAVSGEPLAEPYRFRFTTAQPIVSNAEPSGELISPTSVVRLTFSQAMDAESTQQAFSLHKINSAAALDGVFAWDAAGTMLTFTPTQSLDFGASYAIEVQENALSESGLSNLRYTHSSGFTVAPLPKVEFAGPLNGNHGVNPEGSVSIRFNTNMSGTSVLQHLSITPLISGTQVYSYYNEYDRMTSLNWFMQPRTTYKVTVGAQSKDIYGNTLGKDAVLTFTTGDYLPFMRMDIDKFTHFSADDDVRASLLYRNLNALHVDLYRMPLDELYRLVGENSWELWENYTLPDQKDNRIWSRDYELSSARNETIRQVITLTMPSGEPLAPGLYYLEARNPNPRDAQNPLQRTRSVVALSSDNLILKKSDKAQTLAWLTDLHTGQPVSGQEIRFVHNRIGYAAATTDQEGIAAARLNLPTENSYLPLLAIAGEPGQANFAVASSDWNNGIAPWDFNLPSGFYGDPYTMFFYSERPIYRPGQTIYWKGILRQLVDDHYRLPDEGTQVRIKIYNPMGAIVQEETVKPGAYGTIAGSFTLAAEAMTGYYNLSAEIDIGSGRTVSGGTNIQVGAYRKPEFEISLTSDKPEYIQGDVLRITTNARYFSGGALANAPVTWRVIASPYFFTWKKAPEDRWYSFDPYDPQQVEYDPYSGYSGGLVKEGSSQTDSEGNFVLELPADLGAALQSQLWNIDVTIQSSTNQFVGQSLALPIHRGEFYIGLSPQSYVVQRGDELTIDMVTVKPQGDPYPAGDAAGVDLTSVIYEFKWNSVYEKSADGTFIWKTSVERTPVYTATITASVQGQAAIAWTPEKGGQYQITAAGKDQAGNTISSAAYLWVSDSDYVAWPRRNNDRIDLVADQKRYQPGDTAKILIPSPFAGPVKALLTIERSGVIEARVLELTGASTTIDLPITAEHIPNIYVGVVLVKGSDDSADPLPAQRIGYVGLDLDIGSKALDIAIQPSAEKLHPGDTLTYTLAVRNQAGEAVANSEVSVALVDKAVLSLANNYQQAMLDVFYYKRALGVTTGSTLVINRDRLSQQLSEGQKGGGGGGGPGGVDLRQEFPDTAFWRADFVTDDTGEFSFSVKLPDSLTTWTLLAKAVTQDTLLGEAQHDVIASKELQVRPLLPRFFSAGDRAKIAALVINASEVAMQDVEVTVDIAGASLDGAASTTAATLNANGQLRFNAPISIAAQSDTVVVTMTATAKSGETPFNDGVLLQLPVNRYITPETVATAGSVPAEGVVEEIEMPSEAVDDAELQVKLQPSLAAGMVDGLDYLQHYPYECNEQTVSRFLPNLFTVRALRQLNIKDPTLEKDLTYQLGIGVQRLISRQNSDGGWGYWRGEESQPFISAYVLWGLHNAWQLDYSVDAAALQRAADYLDRSFKAPDQVKNSWELNEMAFMHFVLAEMKKGDPGRASTLFEQRERLGLYGKAYLAMALADLSGSEGGFETSVNTLLNDLIGAADLNAASASWHEASNDWWTMNSDVRTTAVVLAALVQQQPENPLLPNAVRWLMQVRTAGRWATTQENAWSIIALTDWLVASGELEGDYTWQVEVSGQSLGSGAFNAENLRQQVELRVAVADLLKDQALQLQITRSNESGALYYTAYLRYAIDALAVEAHEQGIVVDRRFAVAGKNSANAAVGDVISVTVTVVAPAPLYHVLVEAPIPAGTEPIDRNLATEPLGYNNDGSSMLRPIGSVGETPWFFWVPSYIDVRDDKVAIFATYLPAGAYEYTFQVRATVPGEYRVLPTHAEMMYFPEIWGRSAGALFTVTEQQ